MGSGKGNWECVCTTVIHHCLKLRSDRQRDSDIRGCRRGGLSSTTSHLHFTARSASSHTSPNDLTASAHPLQVFIYPHLQQKRKRRTSRQLACISSKRHSTTSKSLYTCLPTHINQTALVTLGLMYNSESGTSTQIHTAPMFLQ
jgi:hypothetical protein